MAVEVLLMDAVDGLGIEGDVVRVPMAMPGTIFSPTDWPQKQPKAKNVRLRKSALNALS